MRSTERGTRSAERGTWNAEHGTLNTERGTRDTEHGPRNTEHGTRNKNTDHGQRNMEHGKRNTGNGERNTEDGTRNTEYANGQRNPKIPISYRSTRLSLKISSKKPSRSTPRKRKLWQPWHKHHLFNTKVCGDSSYYSQCRESNCLSSSQPKRVGCYG